MQRQRYTTEQIINKLRQPVGPASRQGYLPREELEQALLIHSTLSEGIQEVSQEY